MTDSNLAQSGRPAWLAGQYLAGSAVVGVQNDDARLAAAASVGAGPLSASNAALLVDPAASLEVLGRQWGLGARQVGLSVNTNKR
ncbi:MAG: hypothetical protein ACLQNG_01755 [Acidimicrobiales bacterium]